MKQKPPQAGFTLMETLVSITVILSISACIAAAFPAALLALERAVHAAGTAAAITGTDRFFRRQAEKTHIPYWASSEKAAAVFSGELWRSSKGQYIEKIEILRDTSGRTRGVRVHFKIEEKILQSETLFSSIPVLRNIP